MTAFQRPHMLAEESEKLLSVFSSYLMAQKNKRVCVKSQPEGISKNSLASTRLGWFIVPLAFWTILSSKREHKSFCCNPMILEQTLTATIQHKQQHNYVFKRLCP